MATEACECRHKDTPRDDAFQDNIQKRLNRAIGQLGGVKAMIDDNRYCGDVLLQLAAAEKAVHRVSELILENHLHTFWNPFTFFASDIDVARSRRN